MLPAFCRTARCGNITFERFVDLAKRWRIERDYQELKQELGLGHFEGRSWLGFRHLDNIAAAIIGGVLAKHLYGAKVGTGYHPAPPVE